MAVLLTDFHQLTMPQACLQQPLEGETVHLVALMALGDAHDTYAVEFSRGLHELVARVDAATR